MTAESRSTLVRVWPRYGTSTRSESVAGAGDVVVILMVEEVDISRAVSVEGGGEEVAVLEEAEGRLLPALGRIAGGLLRPIKAMEVITTMIVKWTDRGVTNVRRGKMVVMDGNIMVIIVVIRLKTNEDGGVEADPTSVMSEIEIEIEIGDGREAGAHMTMSVDEEGAEVEVEVETENESTITKTTKRERIAIQGEMMTIAVAIGMSERARRKGVIAAEADLEVEIARRSHQGNIAAGAEAKAARDEKSLRDISIYYLKPGVALLLINTIQLGDSSLNNCFFLSTSHSLRIALGALAKFLQ